MLVCVLEKHPPMLLPVHAVSYLPAFLLTLHHLKTCTPLQARPQLSVLGCCYSTHRFLPS